MQLVAVEAAKAKALEQARKDFEKREKKLIMERDEYCDRASALQTVHPPKHYTYHIYTLVHPHSVRARLLPILDIFSGFLHLETKIASRLLCFCFLPHFHHIHQPVSPPGPRFTTLRLSICPIHLTYLFVLTD